MFTETGLSLSDSELSHQRETVGALERTGKDYYNSLDNIGFSIKRTE